jgi:hypothetical protein
MALIQSGATIYRIDNDRSDVPVLPTLGRNQPLEQSVGRTSAELPQRQWDEVRSVEIASSTNEA